MPNYYLIEERMMKPFKPDGMDVHPDLRGFLDYLRELRQDEFPFPRGHKLAVDGLEDVLLAAGDALPEVESWIRGILTPRANELESMGTNVQIIFRDKLQKSDDFWVEAGVNRRLSLRRIFGSPRRHNRKGLEFFIVGFNLT